MWVLGSERADEESGRFSNLMRNCGLSSENAFFNVPCVKPKCYECELTEGWVKYGEHVFNVFDVQGDGNCMFRAGVQRNFRKEKRSTCN